MLWFTQGFIEPIQYLLKELQILNCEINTLLFNKDFCLPSVGLKNILYKCWYRDLVSRSKDPNESLFSLCGSVGFPIRAYIETCYFTSTWILHMDESRTNEAQGQSVTGRTVVFVRTQKERFQLCNDRYGWVISSVRYRVC